MFEKSENRNNKKKSTQKTGKQRYLRKDKEEVDMKRYLSVFEMITRSSIYKVFAVLLIMAVTELAACYIALQQLLEEIQPSLEEIVDQSYFLNFFRIAYVVVTVVLILSGMNIGSMQSYTLQRLRIKEKWVFVLQSIYNILCYLLLWTVQVVVLLMVSSYYMDHETDVILGNQMVFLAFHRNDFMHSILPFQDILGWFTIFFFLLGTGIMAASFTKRQRSGKIGWSLFLFVAAICICFSRGLGEQIWFLDVFCGYWMIRAFAKAMEHVEVEKNEKQK